MAVQGREAESAGTAAPDGSTERVARAVDNMVGWIARHWLAVFNSLVGIFVALPFLAPVLMHLGLTRLGRLIYLVYTPTCHQLPERSYFLFGPQFVYTTQQLEAAGAVPSGLNILQREILRWPGSPEFGWKVAFCERDVAIYGSMLLAGLVFALIRRHWERQGRRMPKLRLWVYGLLLVPIAVDGFTQLIGLRESDWILRTITGVMFGAATVWLAYPYIDESMTGVWESIRTRLAAQAPGS